MPKISKNTRNLRRKMKGGASTHKNARGPHPYYPARFSVPIDKMSWKNPWSDYKPKDFTADVVLKNARGLGTGDGWADPVDVKSLSEELKQRITFHPDGEEKTLEAAGVLVDGIPRYPVGRTGMTGRGLLGKWGPNHAADPIVTRYDPIRPNVLQMVAIKRNDTRVWAIPGGMVDAGETVSVTVRREFEEEAGNVPPEKKAQFKKLVEELFESGKVVFRGCVDDPRNTDNAWMETTAFHFHCSPTLGAMLPLAAGDDAANVMWLDVDDAQPKYNNLYASHKELVEKVKVEAATAKRMAAEKLLAETIAKTEEAASNMLPGSDKASLVEAITKANRNLGGNDSERPFISYSDYDPHKPLFVSHSKYKGEGGRRTRRGKKSRKSRKARKGKKSRKNKRRTRRHTKRRRPSKRRR